jgi:hypothetical protein
VTAARPTPTRPLAAILTEVAYLTQTLRAVPYDAMFVEPDGTQTQLGAALHRAADLLEALEADNVRFYQTAAQIYDGDPHPEKLAEAVLTAPSYRAFYQ